MAMEVDSLPTPKKERKKAQHDTTQQNTTQQKRRILRTVGKQQEKTVVYPETRFLFRTESSITALWSGDNTSRYVLCQWALPVM